MTPRQKAGFSVVGLPAERTQIHIIFHSVHEFSSLRFCPQIVRGCFWCWGGGGRGAAGNRACDTLLLPHGIGSSLCPGASLYLQTHLPAPQNSVATHTGFQGTGIPATSVSLLQPQIRPGKRAVTLPPQVCWEICRRE